MVRLYGRCPEQWAGTYQAWLGAIHGQDRDRVDAEIQAALRGESQFASRFHVVWPDGSLHQLLALSHTSFDPQGRPMRMLGVTIDLTDQLAQEEALAQARFERQSSQAVETEDLGLFRQSMRSALVGMALCDPQRHLLLQVNPSLCHFFARKEAELLASSWHDLTHPDDLDSDQPLASQLLSGQLDSYRIRKRFLRPNGSIVWGDLSVAAMRHPDGRPNLNLIQIIDISEMVYL